MRHKNQTNEFIKDCIASSYVKLLYEKKKEEIKVSDICKKSGFGRTTYYRHFGNDKSSLVLYIGRKRWEEYKKEHPKEVKENEAHEFVTHCYNNKRFMLMLREQNMIEILFKILFDIYGVQQREDQTLRYGKDIFVGMLFGVVYDWIILGCLDTPESIKAKIQEGFALALQQAKTNK